jgi:TatD DNase family protein
MIDSHCHLADDAYVDDLDAVIDRARGAGVEAALCVLDAASEEEAARAGRLQSVWPAVRFATGVHPHRAGAYATDPDGAASVVSASLAAQPGARTVGEIGLDYHYDFSPRDIQQRVFAAQLAIARDTSLPVVIHTREATDDTFRVLREAGDLRGVFHCFTGDTAMARAALDLGFFVSIAGIVTFPKAGELRDVARLVPVDRLLVETDAPYLAPVPFRGKRNEPGFVARVVEAIAALRAVEPAILAAQTIRNFETFLGPTSTLQTA